MKKMVENIVLNTRESGYKIETIQTEQNGSVIGGYVAIDGVPQYDIEIDLETGQSRTCGYGPGCFWTDWQ